MKLHLKIVFFIFLLIAVSPLFAQGLVPAGLDNVGNQIQEIFTGSLVRIILVCCFAGCAVAYAYNKDNEKMKRNIIAIGISIIIIGAASGIVELIWNASAG